MFISIYNIHKHIPLLCYGLFFLGHYVVHKTVMDSEVSIYIIYSKSQFNFV